MELQNINKTSDLGYLYEKYQKPENKLIKVWDIIMDEYIKEFGISKVFYEYLELKKQALLLYEKALIEKDRPQINFARMKEAEAEELLKQLGNEDKTIFTKVSKYMGRNINPKNITVFEFYDCIRLMTNV